MYYENIKLLNIKTYDLEYKYFGEPIHIYTVDDSFIFEPCMIYNEYEFYKPLWFFSLQIEFINNLVKELNSFLNVKYIIQELDRILISTSFWPKFELVSEFYHIFHIPKIILRKNMVMDNEGLDYYTLYGLSLKWDFSNAYTLTFNKECVLKPRGIVYTESSNRINVYDSCGKIIRSYDMDKNGNKLIKFLIYLFNLSRKEMKYWN